MCACVNDGCSFDRSFDRSFDGDHPAPPSHSIDWPNHARQLDIEALLAGITSSSSSSSFPGNGVEDSADDRLTTAMDTSVAIATDLNIHASSAHGGLTRREKAATPLPDSIKWLLTVFLGLYVGGECGACVAPCDLSVPSTAKTQGLSYSLPHPQMQHTSSFCLCVLVLGLTPAGFGGWISSFVLLEGATLSEAKAAFLVSIFWAAVTIGRCVASSSAHPLRIQIHIPQPPSPSPRLTHAETRKNKHTAPSPSGRP